MSTHQTLGPFLASLYKQYGGTKIQFAKELGITPSSLSHLLVDAPASIELCLRIARVCHVSASRVLQVAGKGHIADLIEALYGQAARFSRPPAIGPRDLAHLDEWRALGSAEQRAVAFLISRISSGHGDAARREAL